MSAHNITVDRILAAWARARAAGYGPGWYDRMAAHILDTAREQLGWPWDSPHVLLDRQRVTAAASALSPRVQWERVIPSGLVPLLRGERPTGFPGRSIDRARAALTSDAPLEVNRGPKTRAFTLALLGHNEPVIDVWSARVAGFDPQRLTPKRYAAARAAYVEASRILQLPGPTPARDVQETTWEWARAARLKLDPG